MEPHEREKLDLSLLLFSLMISIIFSTQLSDDRCAQKVHFGRLDDHARSVQQGCKVSRSQYHSS
jgi:hypothetical protein